MQKFLVTAENGWVQVATGTICRIQVLMGWHPGMLHVFVGTAAPTDDSPYFELMQGEMFVKSSATGDVWVRAPLSVVDCNPSIVTVSADVDSAGGGGAAMAGDASSANQATMITALTGIITELQAKADLGETQPVSLASVPLATDAATATNQATMLTTLSNLLTELQAKADLGDTQPVSLADVPLATGAATALNQASTLTVLDLINLAISARTRPADAQTIDWMSRQYTPALIRVTVSGTVAAGAHMVSIANMGAVNGTVLGTVLKPSEIIDFEPSNINATLTAIAYDATGTEFLISSLTVV